MNSLVTIINRNKLFFLLINFILICEISLAYGVVYEKYAFFLLIGSLFLGALILKSDVIPIILIFIIIFFTEWAVEQKLITLQIMWTPELITGLLFIKTFINKIIKKQKINLYGIWIVLTFLAVTFISIFYNQSNLVSALLFLRLLFRYYILFLIVINLDINERSMKIINSVLVFLFISQLPLSIIKLFSYGQGESPLGLSSHAVTTIFPLIAIGYLLSYYFLYKRSTVYILLSLGFVGFSIIGEKRAFIFFLPLILICIGWFLKDKFRSVFKPFILGILIIFISSYFAFRLIPTLNPQRRIWGEYELNHVINYAYTYTTRTTATGLSIGRTSSTITVFNRLKDEGMYDFLFGFGPGRILKSMFKTFDRREMLRTEYGVGYGVNGLIWLCLQVGCLGILIIFILFFKILMKSIFYFKKEVIPYWRAFALGTLVFFFIMILMSFLYHPYFKDDAISAFYFLLAGFILKRTELIGINKSHSDFLG